MTTLTAPRTAANATATSNLTIGARPQRDRYVDALRAMALMVVVFGHWLATLLVSASNGSLEGTDHLLHTWAGAGWLTWALQVVPLFVFVSAAVNGPSLRRSQEAGETAATWLRGRINGLLVPVRRYLIAWLVIGLGLTVAAALNVSGVDGFQRILGFFSTSLSVHLWFIGMIVMTQLLLPVALKLDARFGAKAAVGLVILAGAIDALRFLVFDGSMLVGLPNLIVVWLVPQQMGLLWQRGRLGRREGVIFVLAGIGALIAGVTIGYPVALVGGDLNGANNVLPPTLMIAALSMAQAGIVTLAAHPVRRVLQNRTAWTVVQVVGAIGMPMYLWHKSFEPVVAATLSAFGQVDLVAGLSPAEPGFWAARLIWIALLTVAIAPFAIFQLRKAQADRKAPKSPRRPVPATSMRRIAAAVVLTVLGIGIAMQFGVANLSAMTIAVAGLTASIQLTR